MAKSTNHTFSEKDSRTGLEPDSGYAVCCRLATGTTALPAHRQTPQAGWARNEVRSRLERESVQQFAIFTFCIHSSLSASRHRLHFRLLGRFSPPRERIVLDTFSCDRSRNPARFPELIVVAKSS